MMNTNVLSELSSAILKLHKSLLEFQKTKVEAETGHTLNPYEMLGAALSDEKFAWLKPISQMIVEIDLAAEEASDNKSPSLESANSPEFESERIKNFWTNPPADFHSKLIEAIQQNPEIAFLFSEVRLKASAL